MAACVGVLLGQTTAGQPGAKHSAGETGKGSVGGSEQVSECRRMPGLGGVPVPHITLSRAPLRSLLLPTGPRLGLDETK
jgi:hypothetical protein